MVGQTVILRGEAQKKLAHELIEKAKEGFVVNIRAPKRSNDQNARMWAMLSDISRAMPQGRRATADQWKAIFMAACGYEVQFLDGLDGGTPFPVGFKTSNLSVRQMSELITFIRSYGDMNGVTWSEPNPYEEDAA